MKPATTTVASVAKIARCPSAYHIACRNSSSEAGPSGTSIASSNPQPSSRRLPRAVLRNLVELHHHSATFLQDPATISEGFKTAFNTLHTPRLTTFNEFTESQRNLHARRGLAGLENLRPVAKHGAGPIVPKGEPRPAPARLGRSAWTGEASWKDDKLVTLTEREARLKEALYGSWERGAGRNGISQVDVGLDGLEEYMQAKGQDVEGAAELWRRRNEEA